MTWLSVRAPCRCCHARHVASGSGTTANESRTGGNGIDDGGIDDAVAQHRHEVAAGGRAADGRRIRHAGHVPFLERDPFHGVEPNAELIGDQGTDPDGSRRRVGADADTAAGQLLRR